MLSLIGTTHMKIEFHRHIPPKKVFFPLFFTFFTLSTLTPFQQSELFSGCGDQNGLIFHTQHPNIIFLCMSEGIIDFLCKNRNFHVFVKILPFFDLFFKKIADFLTYTQKIKNPLSQSLDNYIRMLCMKNQPILITTA